MAEKLSTGINLYDYMTDKNQEIYQGTFGKTDGVNPSSMEVINDFMENKLQINGNPTGKQNFNFIENKVVSDGLVNSIFDFTSSGGIRKYINIGTNGDFQIIADYKYIERSSNSYIFSIGTYSLFAHATNGFGYQEVYGTMPIKYSPYQNGITYSDFSKPFKLVITKIGTKLMVTVNDKTQLVSDTVNWADMSSSTFNYSWNTDGNVFSGNGKGILVYNRILSPKEIQHNFSVLNNAPSINTIHAGDKKLLLSSDTDHVTDRTGRTQEQINRRAYKSKCKEFTSTSGAITVNNAEEGYVLSGEIKGQTVKNLLQNPINYKTSDGRISKATNIPIVLDANKQYTFTANTLKTSGIANVRLQLRDTDGAIITIPLETSSMGISYYLYTTNKIVNKIDFAYIPQTEFDNGAIREVNFMIFEGDVTGKINSYIPFGLSSTQAVISNNSQSYPIYEPTIQGTATGLVPTVVFSPVLPTLMTGDVLDLATKTITFANKTTQVLTDEQMKAYSVYKKVILCNGVGGVYDTFEIKEDGSGVWTQNTKEIILNGSEDWSIGNNSLTNHLQMRVQINDMKNTSVLISDKFVYRNDWAENEHLVTNTIQQLFLYIERTKLATQDVTGFKTWLKSNPITVRYQLTTPIVTAIDKSIMPTIQTADKINILNVDSPVAPSSFTVNVPTSDNLKKEFAVTLLNGYTQVSGSFTPRVALTQDNRVEISLDVTSPAVFNSTIFSIDASIRPSKDIKVTGFVDNIATPITIKTTGEVMLANSVVSKNVYIKEYYRLGVM